MLSPVCVPFRPFYHLFGKKHRLQAPCVEDLTVRNSEKQSETERITEIKDGKRPLTGAIPGVLEVSHILDYSWFIPVLMPE